MNKSAIYQIISDKIKEIKENEIEEISIESALDYRGLGLNSLEMMTLLVYLEDYFEIEFDGEKMLLENYETVSHLIKVVEELKEEGSE